MRIINGEDVDNEMKEALAKLSERKKSLPFRARTDRG